MQQDTAQALLLVSVAFFILSFLSDSFTDFIRPIYIVARVLAGIIPTVVVFDYIKRRGTLRHRTSLFFLLATHILSCFWFVINIKFIHAAYLLWSLFMSSAIPWHTLTYTGYSSISLGEVIIGTLVCAMEVYGAWAAAVALKRIEAQLEARARFLHMSAQRARPPRLTRAQIKEKRARGDFGKLLTEQGFVQG